MKHITTAAEILFKTRKKGRGRVVLDNAIRGHYIEALIWSSLYKQNKRCEPQKLWINSGIGWGPWDFQRGEHRYDNRVRVQVKTKAYEQLWTPLEKRKPVYDLGWNEKKAPTYFSRDFCPDIYGQIESPPSYRCDLFLLGWHGPLKGGRVTGSDQSNPNHYRFVIAPVSKLNRKPTLGVCAAFDDFKPLLKFEELSNALDRAADDFLHSVATR